MQVIKTNAAIIGCGPAGLACALSLTQMGYKGPIHLLDSGRPFARRQCPVDNQEACHGCQGVCNVLAGFGGSVHYGDSIKLSKFPSGRRLYELLGTEHAEALTDAALNLLQPRNDPKAIDFRHSREEGAVPFPLKCYPVATLCSKWVKRAIEDLHARVAETKTIQLQLLTQWRQIERRAGGGFEMLVTDSLRSDQQRVLHADRLIIAAGRLGSRWWRKQVRQLGLEYIPATASAGVRFECPASLLAGAHQLHPDFKISVWRQGIKLKTFCFCAGPGGGRVKFTDYADFTLLDGHVIVEGEPRLANFGLLTQLRDESGEPRPYEWIEQELLSAYRSLRADRPGKPVLQWYPDFCGRRLTCTTLEQFERLTGSKPSVSDYSVANLATLFPPKAHDALCEVFEELLDFFRGLVHYPQSLDQTLSQVGVVGLEIENMWDQLQVSPAMETSCAGLYACGDSAGVSQGILQAAISGIAAAEDLAIRA